MSNETKKTFKIVLMMFMVTQFVMWLTGPVIMVYFMSRITPNVKCLANLVSALVSIGVLWKFENKNVMEWCEKHYLLISATDVACYIVINITLVAYPAYRVILDAIAMASVSLLADKLWDAKFNQLVSGTELTQLRTKLDRYRKIGTFAGSLAGTVIAGFISIDMAIAINCIEMVISCGVYYKLFKRLS